MTAYDAQYLDYFDTVTSITIYAKNEAEFEQYKSLAEDTMKKYHELFDIYDNYDGVSNIKTINDNAGIAAGYGRSGAYQSAGIFQTGV